MMNSTAGDDGEFPPNPFRSQHHHNQQQEQHDHDEDYFTTQAPSAPAYVNPPRHQQFASHPVPPAAPSGPMTMGATTPGAAPQSRWEACMSCFRMSTYTAYFDVDTSDVRDRLQASVLHFYAPDKFRCEVVGPCRTESLKGPDLYGPLWITMTLVFFVAATSNLSAYIRADDVEEFEYDIEHLVHAMTVCFSFVLGAPALWWLVTQCMGMQALMMVDWICLYGYSMVPYLPATFLCLVPWHPWMWLCLTVATVMSGSLVLRNVAAPLLAADTMGNKAAPILLAVMASHVIFLLILKIAFYE